MERLGGAGKPPVSQVAIDAAAKATADAFQTDPFVVYYQPAPLAGECEFECECTHVR